MRRDTLVQVLVNVWRTVDQFPVSCGHLDLDIFFAKMAHCVCGFSLHFPHYFKESIFPSQLTANISDLYPSETSPLK
jgi:hypothetical protein